MPNTYVLQDRFDPRLYFKGLDEVSSHPSFTANACKAPVFIESEANMLEVTHNLKKIKIS